MNKEGRNLPELLAEVGVDIAERDLSAIRQSLECKEELSQERDCILVHEQRFWESSSLRFSTRVSELVPLSEIDTLFSILRLRNLCPLSIRAIREIRGHADPDRLYVERCFLFLSLSLCFLLFNSLLRCSL